MPPSADLLDSSSSTSALSPSFSIDAVVAKYLSSSQSALSDLSALSQEAISAISAFLSHTPTFQLSSFGPTGLVTLDLLSKANLLPAVPVVFIDTLHHFAETYELIERLRTKYPEMRLHIFTPKGCATREQFEARFGKNLWERQPSKFAYYTKAEPRDRAMEELHVTAYINGRRRSQGDQRGELSFLEVDEELNITRVQPLVNWSFEQVWTYLRHHEVPYNALHDRGYKSVGDTMTTSASGDDEGERSGRWKGSHQTECGLHLSPSQLKLLGLPVEAPAIQEGPAVEVA